MTGAQRIENSRLRSSARWDQSRIAARLPAQPWGNIDTTTRIFDPRELEGSAGIAGYNAHHRTRVTPDGLSAPEPELELRQLDARARR